MSAEKHRTYETLGILMKFHAFPSDVMDKFCLVEAVVPPGFGAPPNKHAGETEAFFILDGTVDFMLEGQVTTATAGDYVPIPDGAVHAFTATGDTPARLLILNAPGRMHELFFTAVGERVPAERTEPTPPAGPPDVARVVEIARSAGMTILPPAA